MRESVIINQFNDIRIALNGVVQKVQWLLQVCGLVSTQTDLMKDFLISKGLFTQAEFSQFIEQKNKEAEAELKLKEAPKSLTDLKSETLSEALTSEVK